MDDTDSDYEFLNIPLDVERKINESISWATLVPLMVVQTLRIICLMAINFAMCCLCAPNYDFSESGMVVAETPLPPETPDLPEIREPIFSDTNHVGNVTILQQGNSFF